MSNRLAFAAASVYVAGKFDGFIQMKLYIFLWERHLAAMSRLRQSSLGCYG